MFKKIMLTLDGTGLAEKAFPYAVALSNRLDCTLLLTRVLPLAVDTQSRAGEAYSYLQQVSRKLPAALPQLNLDHCRIKTRVVVGDTVTELTNLAHEEEVDLIVMATRAGNHEDELETESPQEKNIARQLLERTGLPVLMLHPKAGDGGAATTAQEDFSVRFVTNPFLRLVVALDGSSDAERALKPAAQLAEQIEAPVYLLQIHHSTSPELNLPTLVGGEVPGLEPTGEKSLAEKRHYIRSIQNKLLDRELYCPSYVISSDDNDIAREIVKFCQHLPSPALLVMASHPAKWQEETSITAKVLRSSHLPVLILNSVRED